MWHKSSSVCLWEFRTCTDARESVTHVGFCAIDCFKSYKQSKIIRLEELIIPIPVPLTSTTLPRTIITAVPTHLAVMLPIHQRISAGLCFYLSASHLFDWWYQSLLLIFEKALLSMSFLGRTSTLTTLHQSVLLPKEADNVYVQSFEMMVDGR